MPKTINIQLFSNSLGADELAAVESVLASRWIGMEKETEAFEQELGELFGCPHTLTVNCCTAALFIAVKTLGIGPGDEVIIPTVNFVGVPNAVVEVGAVPVFADVDPVTLNILPSEVERLRTKKTKAVFPLHYGGHPCDMDALYAVANGLCIIEDSANAIVSKYKGKHCGTLGDLGCFSFDAMKILSVGDGGALTVNRDELVDRACQYRYLGISTQKSGVDSFRAKNKKWWEINLGTTSGRYISNDIVSAMGRVQLRKLNGFIERRKAIWNRYQRELRRHAWLTAPPEPLSDCTTSYYMYWLTLKPEHRDRLAQYLVDCGIYCTFRYYPLHLIEQYRAKVKLPNAELANDSVLNIPLHQNLSDADVDYIIETIGNFEKTL
jgi:aminotransferase